MERVEIARSVDLPERGCLRFRLPRGDDAVEAFAVRYRGVAYAWVNRCTHRQVELDLGKGAFFHPDGERLLCRAHGAMFDPRTGACSGGICPKGSALEPVPLLEEGGAIYALAG